MTFTGSRLLARTQQQKQAILAYYMALTAECIKNQEHVSTHSMLALHGQHTLPSNRSTGLQQWWHRAAFWKAAQGTQ